MGSINKTKNFDLPQFGDDDKPTWRGDVNDAMNKIEAYLTRMIAVLTPFTDGFYGDGLNDDTAAIQAALDTGADVLITPLDPTDSTVETIVKFTDTLYLRNPRQKLTTAPGVVLCPAFVGDSIQVTQGFQHVQVLLRSDLQPSLGDYSDAYGVRVGNAAGSNPMYYPFSPSLEGTVITGNQNVVPTLGWKGGGVRIEQGPMTDLRNVYISDISGDGFVCGGTNFDPNHIRFDSTHVIRANRGYALLQGPEGPDKLTWSARSNIFENAKAFDCQQNFYIETAGNYGTIFTEWSGAHQPTATPDEFTAESSGNRIDFIGTLTTYAAMIDNGARNLIGGYTLWNSWNYTRMQAKKLSLNNQFGSYWDFTHDSLNQFTEEINGAGDAHITVRHRLDGTGTRTDDFSQGRLKLPSGGQPAPTMMNYQIHSHEIPANTATIPAGGAATFDVGLAAGPGYYGSFSLGEDTNAVGISNIIGTLMFHASGFTSLRLHNTGDTDVDVSGLLVNIVYRFIL